MLPVLDCEISAGAVCSPASQGPPHGCSWTGHALRQGPQDPSQHVPELTRGMLGEGDRSLLELAWNTTRGPDTALVQKPQDTAYRCPASPENKPGEWQRCGELRGGRGGVPTPALGGALAGHLEKHLCVGAVNSRWTRRLRKTFKKYKPKKRELSACLSSQKRG